MRNGDLVDFFTLALHRGILPGQTAYEDTKRYSNRPEDRISPNYPGLRGRRSYEETGDTDLIDLSVLQKPKIFTGHVPVGLTREEEFLRAVQFGFKSGLLR